MAPMTLREIVASRGLKQNWLAERLGLTESTLSRILRGQSEFPVSKIEELSWLLGMGLLEVVRAAKETYESAEQSAAGRRLE